MKKILLLVASAIGTICSHGQLVNDGSILYNDDIITCDIGPTLTFENRSGSAFTGVAGRTLRHTEQTFTNNGNYTCQTGFTDYFVGTGIFPGNAQTLGGTVRPNFHHLWLDNGPGGEIQITNTQGVNVTGTLRLGNGITTTIRSLTSTGAIRMEGAARLEYGTDYAGYHRIVDGYMSRAGFTAYTNYIMPVGTSMELRNLVLSTSTSIPDEVSVSWIAGDPSLTADPSNANELHPVNSRGPGVVAVSTHGQWDFVPVSGTGAGVQIKAFFADMSGLTTDADELILVGWNGSRWVNLSQGPSASQVVDGGSLDGVAVAGIQALAIGKTSSTLPLRFSDVTAKKTTGCTVKISWKTEAEEKIERFNIERSTGGANWNVIGSLAAGSGDYSFTDHHPLTGASVYRVSASEAGNRVTYSSGVQVQTDCRKPELTLYPNPASLELAVSGLRVGSRITVYNVTGIPVYQGAATGFMHSVPVRSWPSGVYSLQVNEGGQIINKLFVIKH